MELFVLWYCLDFLGLTVKKKKDVCVGQKKRKKSLVGKKWRKKWFGHIQLKLLRTDRLVIWRKDRERERKETRFDRETAPLNSLELISKFSGPISLLLSFHDFKWDGFILLRRFSEALTRSISLICHEYLAVLILDTLFAED